MAFQAVLLRLHGNVRVDDANAAVLLVDTDISAVISHWTGTPAATTMHPVAGKRIIKPL